LSAFASAFDLKCALDSISYTGLCSECTSPGIP
jgi:hypothetical protein